MYILNLPFLPTHSGGTEFTIRGTNLDIVQVPRLLVHVTNGRRRRRRQSVMIAQSEVRNSHCDIFLLL